VTPEEKNAVLICSGLPIGPLYALLHRFLFCFMPRNSNEATATVRELAGEEGKERSTWRYLRQLEDLDLIERRNNGAAYLDGRFVGNANTYRAWTVAERHALQLRRKAEAEAEAAEIEAEDEILVCQSGADSFPEELNPTACTEAARAREAARAKWLPTLPSSAPTSATSAKEECNERRAAPVGSEGMDQAEAATTNGGRKAPARDGRATATSASGEGQGSAEGEEAESAVSQNGAFRAIVPRRTARAPFPNVISPNFVSHTSGSLRIGPASYFLPPYQPKGQVAFGPDCWRNATHTSGKENPLSCQGHLGDYLCPGWRIRAEAIKERDGHRCRGCDRDEDAIFLEVHHRRYGDPGHCGECFLTRVDDDDLLTLCVECHLAITNVRRAARYANRVIEVDTIASPDSVHEPIRVQREIEIGTVGTPPAAQAPIRMKAEVTVELTTVPEKPETVVRKSEIVPVEFFPEPDAAGIVIRPRQFNPFGKD
jgi:hypothetical protein